jgi:hypothetical protein
VALPAPRRGGPPRLRAVLVRLLPASARLLARVRLAESRRPPQRLHRAVPARLRGERRASRPLRGPARALPLRGTAPPSRRAVRRPRPADRGAPLAARTAQRRRVGGSQVLRRRAEARRRSAQAGRPALRRDPDPDLLAVLGRPRRGRRAEAPPARRGRVRVHGVQFGDVLQHSRRAAPAARPVRADRERGPLRALAEGVQPARAAARGGLQDVLRARLFARLFRHGAGPAPLRRDRRARLDRRAEASALQFRQSPGLRERRRARRGARAPARRARLCSSTPRPCTTASTRTSPGGGRSRRCRCT